MSEPVTIAERPPGAPENPRGSGTGPVRMLVVWCPDWPVVAASAVAGFPAQHPVAVVAANQVVACSAVARADGVQRGMRRREAQARCPELAVFADDPARDARMFEPVAAAVEELAVGVEVVRAGVVAVPARGPAGYFGGEFAAAERIIDHVAARTGAECQIGIADGLFAATLAAHRGVVVEPGAGAQFLAPLGVYEFGRARTELVDLLRRLGLRTLGEFGRLTEREVASRFGADAVLAHRLARGMEERPPTRRRPPPELAVTELLDPPVDRVDAAAFVARALGERLHAGLAAHGLACTRLAIHASTDREQLRRVWRCADPLTPNGIADRVRWQLDGWLRGPAEARPKSAITVLRLEPEETVDGRALQLGLWRGHGEHAEQTERAGRAMVHVQGLLGPDGVLTPVLGGGRGPGEQVRLVPWGDERAPSADPVPPWPGRSPAPSPSTVLQRPVPVTVLDRAGCQIEISGRHGITGRPCQVAVNGSRPRRVVGWAGPWWGNPPRSRTRMQVLLAEESEVDSQEALLLVHENQRWMVEGRYT